MNVEVLGNVQDGGVPHLGCSCKICEKARENDRKLYNSSILLKDDNSSDSVKYIIDATPDIRFQITGEYVDGIFISHAHLGHVTGLLYFGEEGTDSRDLSVYCNQDVEDFLMKNDPFRLLVDRGNIDVESFSDGDMDIQGGEIRSISMDHPHINHRTTAYMVIGEERKLFYLSDCKEFTDEVVELIEEADIAIIDGTFWNSDEIDRYDEVPHPTIEDSIARFSDTETEIYFTHLNHTNPVLREDSDERKELEENGFKIALTGKEFSI